MNCAISDKQFPLLVTKVTANINDLIKSNTPFDIENYAKDLYKGIVAKTGDHVTALNFVMALPTAVLEAQHRNSDIQIHLAAQLPELVKLRTDFLDTEKAISYIGLTSDAIALIKNAQNQVKEIVIPKESTLSKQLEPAKPSHAFTTTGQEASGNTKEETLKNIPDSSKAIYYKVMRSIIEQVDTPLVDNDSRNLNLPGVKKGGLYLTAISATRIPFEKSYPEIQDYLTMSDIPESQRTEAEKQKRLKAQSEGVVMALTNIDGEIINFDDKGDVAYPGAEGKPMYYMLRKPVREGNKFVTKTSIQSPEAAAKAFSKLFGRPVTPEEADDIQQVQLQNLNAMREYIIKNPGENHIRSYIKGGSLGYVESFPGIHTDFSSLKFDTEHPFNPVFQADNAGPFHKTAVYFYYKGVQTPILLQRKPFNEDLINNIATLLTSRVSMKNYLGENVALTPKDKLDYVQNYVQTTDEGIQISISQDGKDLQITINGEVLDLSDETDGEGSPFIKIYDYLTKWSPISEVNKPISDKNVVDGTKPGWEEQLWEGKIVKTLNEKGKEVYHKYGRAQININRAFLTRPEAFEDFSITLGDNAFELITTKKNYFQWLGENTFINYKVNAEGKLQLLNSYFDFQPLQEDMDKVYPKDTSIEEAKTEAPKQADLTSPADSDYSDFDKLSKDIDEGLDGLNKITQQKLENKQATEEQMKLAKSWYDKSPLSKFFPYKTAFGVINQANPDSVAKWTLNGITLYQGSDYSDLYHEAWHGFTQGFLTKQDKQDLYNELRKKSGSFKTYQGKVVSFKSARDLELEEYLAEDFRKYMLSRGKTLASPKRNSIFRRILDFFRALFGDSTIAQVSIDDLAIAKINELYEKLRIGDLSQYSFSASNVNYSILNKAFEAISSDEPLQSLSYEDSRVMVDTIDSLFSEFIDFKNSGLVYKDMLEMTTLENKKRFKQPYDERRLAELQGAKTAKFTSTILTTLKGRTIAYKYAQMRLAHLRNETNKAYETGKDEFAKEQLKKNLDLLDYALRNYGDPEKPMGTADGKGLIGYHNLKSKYLSFEDKYMEVNENDDDALLKGREGYDRSGNEMSLTDLASKETLYLIRSLFAVDKKGFPVRNKLGINSLAEFGIVWNRLAKVLQGSYSPKDMEDKLIREQDSFPVIRQLLQKLGPASAISGPEFRMWTAFWKDFNLTRVPLIQMTLDKISTADETGEIDITYTAKVGEASTDFKKAGQSWNNLFQTTYSNPYIKRDKNNVAYLDVPAVLKEFKSTLGREFDFFRAIGVALSDKAEIRKAVSENIGKAPIIRSVLFNLNKRGIVINSVDMIFRTKLPGVVIKGGAEDGGNLVLSELRGEGGNYNHLMTEETRYSDQYSNFSVTNAEGNLQHEHSLNSTLTVIVNTINRVKSFDELMQIPHMEYLNPDRNPFAASSIWLKSIFEMDKPGRPKRRESSTINAPFVKISLENLSGVQLTNDGEFESEGISSAKADEVTKFLMDFHSAILRGKMEFPRHSDKGTSYAGNISNIVTEGTTSGNYYIDIENFINNRSKGMLFKIITPYIAAELKRINIMKNASTLDAIRNVPDYYERGKNFVMFDDVLSINTKKKLEALSIPLEEYLALPEATDLIKALDEDIEKYFDSITKKTQERFNKTKFVADNLIREFKGASKDSQIKKASRDQVLEAMLKAFTINTWIHNMESINVIYGDVALYNMDKEEFHKRNAGVASTGGMYRTDESAMNYVNNTLGMGYAASKGLFVKAFGPVLNTSVLEDTDTLSVYYDQYKKNIQEELTERYYKRKDYLRGEITKSQLDKEIKAKVNTEMEAYEHMKEGDAQGWITFDSYRALLSLENKWTPKHEELYQMIIKGERVLTKEVTNFFATQKLQYYGPLATTTGLPVVGFHKFSVFPLIPTVIKDTTLEKLHDKMVAEGIDYSLFKSGSKVSTITNKGVVDKLYTDYKTKSFDSSSFIKNPIHLAYLKNQLEIASTFKGKSIFSTQLRKLIEGGLMEGGVPTDFKPEESLDNRRTKWDKLSETSKRKTSARYKLLITYENNIAKLTEVKKKDLLREAGWVIGKDGKPKGDLEPLLKFVRSELTRQDLADHEIDFVDLNKNHNQLKHDLSMSLSADKIEKLLIAIVNKRLIRQKVNGEGLIQVSGIGFENLNAYNPKRNLTNPTEGDLRKYGSNDLPTYHKGTNGNTRAMKVKIALQGQFEKLLEIDDVVKLATNKKISRIEALNELIKDEPWLNTGSNRKMITMVGVRIPVQGLNSMEFMEVHEFLPKEAGSILVPPAEIVAKSGSDFDIDKLTIMMPSFKYQLGKLTMSTQYSEADAKLIYDKVKKKKMALSELKDDEGNIIWANDNAVDKLLTDIFGNFWDKAYTQDELNDLLKTANVQTFEDFFDTLNGSKAIENDLINNIKEILELPENFVNLIRPNGTDLVKPTADYLSDKLQGYDPKQRVQDGPRKGVSGTRVLEMDYNLYKHASNNIGKQTLGLGAVDNSYNVVFNRIGAHLNPTYSKKLPTGKMEERPITIHMPHNTLDVNGKETISMSHMFDANNENNISDIISQLINGWVDVAKDTWIFNIQGNKEVAPVLLFMIQAGVPFEQAVYFVSQPLIREYINEQRLAKSTFSGPLGKAPAHPNFFRRKAKEAILLNPMYDFPINKSIMFSKKSESAIYNMTQDYSSRYKETAFTKEALDKNLNRTTNQNLITEEDKAVFLHYLELEDIARSIRDIKLRMNFDTKRSTTLFEAQNRDMMVDMLRADGKVPNSVVNNILNNSPIGSFNIQDFIISLWSPLFKLRNSSVVNGYLLEKFKSGISGDIEDTYVDPEKFVAEFKNDLISFIFQNSVKSFDLANIKNFKGFNVDTSIPVSAVSSLRHGVFVKDGTLYVDKEQLRRDYETKAFSESANLKNHISEYNPKTGLALVNATAFQAEKEYFGFVFEREYLRSIYPTEKIKNNTDYISILAKNITDKKIQKDEGETKEDFETRLKKISYEQFLRDKALDNTFNSWKMFESDTSYAEEFSKIKDSNPHLENEYLLLRLLSLSISKGGMKNLRSLDSSLDSDKLNTLHENLLNLSNPSVVKVADATENERISKFFSRFPLYAFMQSGLSTKGAYSLIRFVPLDKFTRIMEGPIKAYTDKINDSVLDKFYRMFVNLNNVSNKRTRFRHKNYVIETSKKASTIESTSPVIEDTATQGIKTYNPTGLLGKASVMQGMVQMHPEMVFVYNRTKDSNKKGFENSDGVIQEATMGLTLGIPTKLSYSEGGITNPMTLVNNSIKDETLDENKAVIDSAIQQLLEMKNSGRDIVFNKNGYGQGMIGRDTTGKKIEGAKAVAPQTFLYLSEELFKKFGFVNNNFLMSTEGTRLVQEKQPVTDDEVREFMNRCINF